MRWLSWLGTRDEGKTHLHMEVHGQGDQTLVFIPGLGGTTRYWASRLRSMPSGYRAVLVDLLGFGQSPKPWSRYSVEHHVEALHTSLQTLGPVSLIGHSLGALLTFAYAARHPDQVKNIIVLGMPYFGSQQMAYQHLRKGPVKAGYLYTNIVLTVVTCVLTRRVIGRLLPYLLRDVPREVAEDLVKHTWRSSTSSLWEVVYRYDAAADLERLPAHIGVLFIHGDQDVMVPVGAIQLLTASQNRGRLHVLPGVDHHPFLRNPEKCLELIDEQIQSSTDNLLNAAAHSLTKVSD